VMRVGESFKVKNGFRRLCASLLEHLVWRLWGLLHRFLAFSSVSKFWEFMFILQDY